MALSVSRQAAGSRMSQFAGGSAFFVRRLHTFMTGDNIGTGLFELLMLYTGFAVGILLCIFALGCIFESDLRKVASALALCSLVFSGIGYASLEQLVSSNVIPHDKSRIYVLGTAIPPVISIFVILFVSWPPKKDGKK